MKNLIFLVSLILVSCATKPLSQAEMSVRILKKSDAPATCKEVGKVHVPGLICFSEECREGNFKRKTVEKGGDLVVLDNIDENNTWFGTAFKCK